ncbi:MAG: WD40 domain-containing protein, partial [Oculatellaceae cyanobacterium Prado106]|nr:WD40 domain-containing protein [Oculatellaceae cyanobacterium Prado106]
MLTEDFLRVAIQKVKRRTWVKGMGAAALAAVAIGVPTAIQAREAQQIAKGLALPQYPPFIPPHSLTQLPPTPSSTPMPELIPFPPVQIPPPPSIDAPISSRNNNIWSISWSSDGQTLASGGSNGTVKLWTRQGEA